MPTLAVLLKTWRASVQTVALRRDSFTLFAALFSGLLSAHVAWAQISNSGLLKTQNQSASLSVDSVNTSPSLTLAQFKESPQKSPPLTAQSMNSAMKSKWGCSGSEWTGVGVGLDAFKAMDALKKESVIQWIQSFESECLKSAPYYAQLGQYLLLAKRPKDALEALERSLLIEADQPAVQLDFAISLAESGDPISAKALVDQVLLRPDLPSALREALLSVKGANGSAVSFENQELGSNGMGGASGGLKGEGAGAAPSAGSRFPWSQKWDQIFGSEWMTQGNAQLLYGHDSNLNSASTVSTINLTLPNGTVPLTLDASSLPQKGVTQIAALQFNAQRPLGDKFLLLSGSWMGRNTPNNPGLGFNNEELLIQLKPEKDLGIQQRVVFNHFEIGGSNFYNALSYALWSEKALDQGFNLPQLGLLACRARFGGEIERRTYAQDPTQNGIFGGGILGGTCTGERDQFNLSVISGLDWASDAMRAGGNQRRQELKTSWIHAINKARLSLEWGEQWINDDTIYSDLLGGINRNTLRKSTKISFQYPIEQKLSMMSGSLFWVSYWESLRYSSSVDLFNLRGESVQTGLKWDF